MQPGKFPGSGSRSTLMKVTRRVKSSLKSKKIKILFQLSVKEKHIMQSLIEQ